MERKVTVWESSKQKKTVLTSNAETLGQLKQEMVAKGIDLTNMSIFEGVSHVKLLSDESILPHDIPYKGTITNNLMIMLSLQNKKVSSGIDRKAIGAWISENNLKDVLLKECGDNWTRLSTDKLIAFYKCHHTEPAPTSTIEPETKEAVRAKAEPAPSSSVVGTSKEDTKKVASSKLTSEPSLVAWAKELTTILHDYDILIDCHYDYLMAILSEDSASEEEEAEGFSKEEIADMIRGL